MAKTRLHTAYSIWLTPGSWQQLFTNLQYHTMIAACLNDCAHENGMVINGYVITNSSICLVLQNERKKCHDLLSLFYECVQNRIAAHCKHNHEKDDSIYLPVYNLFIKHHVHNPIVIQLLTDQKAAFPFYNEAFERLKYILQNEPFCSVIDYSGAVGPVIISKPENNVSVVILILK